MLASSLRRTLWGLALCGAALPLALSHPANASVVDPAGRVAPEVVEICALVARAHQLEAPAQAPSYAALAPLHAFSEAHLRRPAQAERGDAEARAFYARLTAPLSTQQQRRLEALFAALNETEGHAQGSFDYVLVGGTTVDGLRRELTSLVDAVLGRTIKLGPGAQIIFLDGERPLYASETLDVLLNPEPFERDPTFTPPPEQPQDGREVTEMVYRQLWLPPSVRACPTTFVHAARHPNEGALDPVDIVRDWLEGSRPHRGRALLIAEHSVMEEQQLAAAVALREAHAPAISIAALDVEDAVEASERTQEALGMRLDNLAARLAYALELRTQDEQAIQPSLLP